MKSKFGSLVCALLSIALCLGQINWDDLYVPGYTKGAVLTFEYKYDNLLWSVTYDYHKASPLVAAEAICRDFIEVGHGWKHCVPNIKDILIAKSIEKFTFFGKSLSNTIPSLNTLHIPYMSPINIDYGKISPLLRQIDWRAGRIEAEVNNGILKIDNLQFELESIGSSVRIEGNKMNNMEINTFLQGKQIVNTEDEGEVLGMKEAYELLFRSGDNNMKILSLDLLLRLHNVLMRRVASDAYHAGRLKYSQVDIYAAYSNGTKILFLECTPYQYEQSQLSILISWYNEESAAQNNHPLINVATFIVCWLKIHPFTDGNGRMSRLLTVVR